MPGIIALDIDGTITQGNDPVSLEVVNYFTYLSHLGWHLIFITGRSFFWSSQALGTLPFPYHIAVQQGAYLIEMPSRKILAKKYLDRSILSTLEMICEREPTDIVIFAGFEYNDLCYFRPKHFAPTLLEYVLERAALLGETWVELSDFERLEIETFASVKCFGEFASVKRICDQIEIKLELHAPIVRDPFHSNYYVGQATHLDVSKGNALKIFRQLSPVKGPIIAVGDDWNDQTMFAEADYRVVMENAPLELQKLGDLIAPPVHAQGVIAGLKKSY